MLQQLLMLHDNNASRTGERRRLGRLEYDGAAAGERGPELPAEHRNRVVPLRAPHGYRFAQLTGETHQWMTDSD